MSDTALPSGEDRPFVSVVVPVYNRAAALQACLASLFTQTYPQARYEVIVVDDGSTDPTPEQARAAAEGWTGTFRLLQKTNGGPASARNAGIRVSQADIIAFIDSDCVAAPDWLEHLVGVLAASDASGVGGPLINAPARGLVACYLHACDFFRHRVRHGKVDYLLTANAAFRRQALLQVRGFSERKGAWGEDADLSFRLRQTGYTLLLAEQGIVTHYGMPVSVRALMRSLYHYGYGNGVLSPNWKHRRPLFVEVLRHGGAILLSPLLALSHLRRVGIWLALAFWPLIVLEHAAFVAGLLSALTQEGFGGKQ